MLHYKTILYVEDSLDDFEVFKHALGQTKHQGDIVRLNDEEEARAYFTSNHIRPEKLGMILVDLHLPIGDGLGVVKHIRDQPEFHNVPVILMSGSYSYEALEGAYSAGANLHLLKPTNLTGWSDMVSRLQDYFATTT
jgi:CheY-like chemotaxis protein